MFSDFGADFRATILKYFPERQIYLRSGGEVSYFVLTTRIQVAVTALAVTMTVWCIFTLYNAISGNNPFIGPNQQSKMVKAEYERLLQDAQAKYDTARQQLTLQQESFEKATKSFQEKHAAIARLVNQPVLESSSAFVSLHDAKISEGKVLLEPTIRDAFPRVERTNVIESVELDTGLALDNPMAKLDTTQNEILLSVEAATISNIERSRAIIESTDMSVEDVISAGDHGLGGPLLEVADIDESTSPRIQGIKARAYEAKLLSEAISSMPMGYPVNAESYRTSSFGVRKDPFTKRPAMHQALDIASYPNAPIVATAAGTVIYAGRRLGYGRVVDIDHGHGFVTRYAHMSKIQVKRGQKVAKGDNVGLMGSSGRSTSNHLHYEVRFNDKVYDPDKFMKAGQYVQ